MRQFLLRWHRWFRQPIDQVLLPPPTVKIPTAAPSRLRIHCYCFRNHVLSLALLPSYICWYACVCCILALAFTTLLALAFTTLLALTLAVFWHLSLFYSCVYTLTSNVFLCFLNPHAIILVLLVLVFLLTPARSWTLTPMYVHDCIHALAHTHTHILCLPVLAHCLCLHQFPHLCFCSSTRSHFSVLTFLCAHTFLCSLLLAYSFMCSCWLCYPLCSQHISLSR